MKITEDRLKQIIEQELKSPSYRYTVAGYRFSNLREAKKEALQLRRPVLDKNNKVVVEWKSAGGPGGLEAGVLADYKSIEREEPGGRLSMSTATFKPEALEPIAAAMPDKKVLTKDQAWSQSSGGMMPDDRPDLIVPLGYDSQHIYFKDLGPGLGQYYRIPNPGLTETVGVAGVQHDPDLNIQWETKNIQEDGFGEGTPPAGEAYKKQVISMEEGPLEIADKINDVMSGLLDLLKSRDAKQLNDPKIRELEALLSKKKEEEDRKLGNFLDSAETRLGIGKGGEDVDITASQWGIDTGQANKPTNTLEGLVKEVIEEIYGSGPGGKIGFKHVKGPRSIGGPVSDPAMHQASPQHTEEDFVITPIKMASGKYPGQLYAVTHRTQPHNPLRFYRSEQEAEKDLPGVVEMANQFPSLLNL